MRADSQEVRGRFRDKERKTSAAGGDFFLMRGSYTNHMRRTADGWRIESLTQHVSWAEGNAGGAPAEAAACFQRSTPTRRGRAGIPQARPPRRTRTSINDK